MYRPPFTALLSVTNYPSQYSSDVLPTLHATAFVNWPSRFCSYVLATLHGIACRMLCLPLGPPYPIRRPSISLLVEWLPSMIIGTITPGAALQMPSSASGPCHPPDLVSGRCQPGTGGYPPAPGAGGEVAQAASSIFSSYIPYQILVSVTPWLFRLTPF
jgi:hypothetical protein